MIVSPSILWFRIPFLAVVEIININTHGFHKHLAALIKIAFVVEYAFVEGVEGQAVFGAAHAQG